MSAQNKALVQDVNEAMRRGDTEAFLARCTDDFVWTIVGDEPIVGKDALRKFMAQMPADPPDFTVESVIAEGDTVVARGVMSMAENGRDVPYAFCDVWRIKGDKLASLNAFVVKTERAPKAAAAGRG
jgi:ketosteroid isomerase-like protein